MPVWCVRGCDRNRCGPCDQRYGFRYGIYTNFCSDPWRYQPCGRFRQNHRNSFGRISAVYSKQLSDAANNAHTVGDEDPKSESEHTLRYDNVSVWQDYASSVKYPGKITVNKYQRIGEIRSNRPALTIKHAVDSALMNRLVFDKLRGNVEITTIPFKVRSTKLYLITAGEIQKRKVLRIWAEVYAEKPKDIYGFVEKYIDKGAILHYQWGDADESTLQKMGYASGAHRHDYRCATIENESNFLIRQLQSTTKMSEAKKILLRTCAERNSMYIPIAFDDLLKRIIALPSGTKE